MILLNGDTRIPGSYTIWNAMNGHIFVCEPQPMSKTKVCKSMQNYTRGENVADRTL